MNYGYARVSTDGQNVDAQERQLRAAGCEKVSCETARRSGPSFGRHLPSWTPVTRLDRLARSARDFLNTLDTIADRKAGFRSLSDTWADTITSHGRLMLTVLGGLAKFERDLTRARTGGGRERAKAAA
jgi:DNA invertase Pin-like site-specific DNA recombinase